MRVINIASLVAIATALVICNQSSFAQEPSETGMHFQQGLFSEFSYDYSSNTQRFGFDMGVLADFHGGFIEYSTPMSFLRLARLDGETVYSLGLPVSIGLLSAARLASKIFMGEHQVNEADSLGLRVTPFHFLFLFPNSSYRFRITDKLRPTISMNTDYLLYRTGRSSRGLLFTPTIGITLFKHWGNIGRRGLNIYAGRSMFWSFDNRNRASEFIFGITLFGYPID